MRTRYIISVRAGSAKNRIYLPEVADRQALQIRTWKLEALTVAQYLVQICKSKQFGNPTRYRRDIQESSKLRTKLPTLDGIFGLKSVWQLQKSVVPDQVRWKLVYSPEEDTMRRSISVALPISSPLKRYGPKTIHIQKWQYCNAPLNFASFDLEF